MPHSVENPYQKRLTGAFENCLIPIYGPDGLIITQMCNGDYFALCQVYSQEQRATLIKDYIYEKGNGNSISDAIANMDAIYGESNRKIMIENYLIRITNCVLESVINKERIDEE